jgi:hypothetical protein
VISIKTSLVFRFPEMVASLCLKRILMRQMQKDSDLGLLILRDSLSWDFEEEENIHCKILNTLFTTYIVNDV